MRYSRKTSNPGLCRLLCLFLVFFIVGAAGAQDSTCLEVYPNIVNFYGDLCDGWLYQESIEYRPTYIEAVCGDTGLYWEVSVSVPWIGVMPPSGWDSDSVLIWIIKDQLSGLPDSLPPGDTLILHSLITITAADPMIPPQEVMVVLHLTCAADQPLLMVQPPQFVFEASAGDVLADSLFIYEAHGDTVLVAWSNSEPWLQLPMLTVLLSTPGHLPLTVTTDGLAPGAYQDVIVLIAYQDGTSPPFDSVLVPVTLHVQDGGNAYSVATIPSMYNISLFPGEGVIDSLHVFEVHGHNVPFYFSNTQPWLVVEPFGMPPYMTPVTLTVVIGTANLPPGIYVDTIMVSPTHPDFIFDTVRVPVQLQIDTGGFQLVVEPQSFDYTVPWGHYFYDYLHIDELHGETLLLNFYNNQPWLTLPMFFVAPPTPMTLEFGVSTEGLAPGTYSDVITVVGYLVDSLPPVDVAHVPVTLTVTDDQPFEVRTAPDYFEYALPQGTPCFTDHFLVYDLDSANLVFATTVVNNSAWLILDSSSMYGVTPSQVYFQVCPDGLAPGYYSDSVLVYYPLDNLWGFDDVFVPVVLQVLPDSQGAIVATEPTALNFSVHQGQVATDELHVFEIHGEAVPFHVTVAQPWLEVGTCFSYPCYTPVVLPATVLPESMEPGWYSDTIVIFPDTDGVSFPPVHVPVTMYVMPGGSGDNDSLIIPSLSVLPCDWECVAQPVQTKLSQPIKGATIPISIPVGVEICSLSTAGLITQGWDWTFFDINDSLGYAFVALANSFDATIPPGVTTVFNMYFNIGRECRESSYYHWDTTLMLDVSKHLAFTDTAYATVYPGFDMYRDSVEVLGFTPGDFDNDGIVSISDLVGVVDYMFAYGPPPCIIDAIDVNGDCIGPDISDLVALIDYMFMPWDPPPEFPPEPECGCVSADGGAVAKLHEDIILRVVYESGVSTLILSSPIDLRGVQLEVRGSGDTKGKRLTDERLDLIQGVDGGVMKVGIVDLDGAEVIAAGQTPLISLRGEIGAVSAVVTDNRYRSMAAAVDRTGSDLVPGGHSLHQNYPNPFNPITAITFNLPLQAPVRLEVFNIAGQRVATLVDGSLGAGEHTVSWNAGDLSSGVYLYRLTSPGFVGSRKMVLLK